MTDQELVTGILSGNKAASNLFHEKYNKLIWAGIKSSRRSLHEDRNVYLHNAYLELFMYLKRWDPTRSSLASFVYKLSYWSMLDNVPGKFKPEWLYLDDYEGFESILPNVDEREMHIAKDILAEASTKLTNQEQYILYNHVVNEETFENLGKGYGLTKERVRQICDGAKATVKMVAKRGQRK